MGAHTEFFINRVCISSTGWSYRPRFLLMFREDDRVEESGEEGSVLRYETTASVAKDRLEVLGYSLDACRAIFERNHTHLLEELETLCTNADLDSEAALLLEADLSRARAMTYERWSADVQSWIRNPTNHEPPYGPSVFVHLDPEAAYDLLGFPHNNALAAVRVVLESCSPEAPVSYDLGDLVDHGFIDADADLAAAAQEDLGPEYFPGGRIIVLTEGSFDARVLERSLRLLAPHIAQYYSFMEFDALKVPGGAGNAIGLLKAFVGAGVANRIVALLDNDTAAREALKPLTAVKLPPRAKVLHYPPLELLRTYPALGPTGNAVMDLNGLAGSIELYLGRDVLTDSTGDLIPIQWRGYSDALKQYQGEITRKSQVQDRFLKKLDICERDRSLLPSYDWDGLRAIIATLRTAYRVDQV